MSCLCYFFVSCYSFISGILKLEVPERGGATVFPRVGVSIQPSRRSAAFWHNMHENGEGDILTHHAACPVLFGTKWVSNKWIHERGQEFKRPCTLENTIDPAYNDFLTLLD